MKRMASLLVLSCSVMLTGCPGVGQIVRTYNFTEVRPASTLLAPGTVVWVKHANPFNAGIVCTQRASLGKDFVPLQSPTTDAAMRRAVNTEFHIDADYLREIKVDLRFQLVNNVTVKLHNANVLAISDTDVMTSLEQRNPLCDRAIAARRAAGYKISMISQALLADVTYNVEFKQQTVLDPQSRAQITKDLALKLGIDVSLARETTIEGKGLYWGIVDDKYLASITPEGGETSPAGQRMFAASDIPRFDFSPDVDVD